MTALRTNDAYDSLFDQYGQIYNVDPLLGKTVFHLESSGNPGTKPSSAGAQGGMQIMPKLAAHYGIDPHDMTQAIPAAMAYLAEGLQATGGDPAGALAYYNGGPKTLQRWLPETQGYVAKAQSYYPQMKLAANTPAAAPGTGPTATDTPSPMMMASAEPPDVNKFHSEWGIGGAAPATPQSADVDAFHKEWGINPANNNAPVAPRPIVASDAAASSADRLPPTVAMGNPATALNALGGDQFIPNPLAANPSQDIYSALRSAVARDPSLTYSQYAPVAMDAAGQPHFVSPGIVHDLMGGAVDALYGPRMGTMTPEATQALATGMMIPRGPLSSPAYNPGRFTLLPRSAPLNVTPRTGAPSPPPNPLVSPGVIEAPAPSFGSAGRNFEVDAQGNVTSAQTPVPVGAVPPPPPGQAPANPLAARAAGALAVPPTSTSPTAPTPADQLIAASIKSRPAVSLPGAPIPPPGSPPGTPPLGVPGYAPTTPGMAPAAVAGLSPAEAAAYASMHDTPPPAPMIPPQTKAQAEALADRVIQHFHTGNPPIAPANLVVPPGYHPTLTGLTNDPGLATLHRGLESVSGTPAVIAQHNAQAINMAAGQLVGQPGDVAAMEAARDAITAPMREAAFANRADADPQKVQAVVSAADKILSGPDGKRPGVVKYVTQIRDALRSDTGNGAPESDPEMLYGAHKAVNDLLSPLAQSTDADKQAAAASLMKLKPLLQTAIESGASGFKDYMAKHAELSKPIDAQKFLQSLNLTNATGDVRLQAVDSAIKNIQKQQQLPGVPKAKWVSDDQMDQLVALRNALRMEAARGAGKPINSTTFQNLATNSKVSQIAGSPLASLALGQMSMPGLVGLGVGMASKAAIEKSLARSEGMVKDALLERLLNFSGKGEASLVPPPPLAAGPRSARPGPGAPWNPLNATPPP